MADKTLVDYADATLNVVTGCTHDSKGCDNCCAERSFNRLANDLKQARYVGRKFSNVQCHLDQLQKLFSWQKPRTILMPVMGDLFHPDVPDSFIIECFEAVAANPRHTVLVTTKREQRLADLWYYNLRLKKFEFPDNLYFGVSVEDTGSLICRSGAYDGIPVKKKWLSFGPLIEELDPRALEMLVFERPDAFDWIVVEGETAKPISKARPIPVESVRLIRDLCRKYSKPFFFKQWGVYNDQGELVGKHKAGHLIDGVEYRDVPWGYYTKEATVTGIDTTQT